MLPPASETDDEVETTDEAVEGSESDEEEAEAEADGDEDDEEEEKETKERSRPRGARRERLGSRDNFWGN